MTATARDRPSNAALHRCDAFSAVTAALGKPALEEEGVALYEGDANPTDVWQFPKVTSGANRSADERTPHPAQFPLAVIDRIIKACSNPGDLVLDPFAGSGTTAEAALSNGRRVVGFEIRPDYIDIAARRIKTAIHTSRNRVDQLTLFESDNGAASSSRVDGPGKDMYADLCLSADSRLEDRVPA